MLLTSRRTDTGLMHRLPNPSWTRLNACWGSRCRRDIASYISGMMERTADRSGHIYGLPLLPLKERHSSGELGSSTR